MMESEETLDGRYSIQSKLNEFIDCFHPEENTSKGVIIDSIRNKIIPKLDYRSLNFEEEAKQLIDSLEKSGDEFLTVFGQLIDLIINNDGTWNKQINIADIDSAISGFEEKDDNCSEYLKTISQLMSEGYLDELSLQQFLLNRKFVVNRLASDLMNPSLNHLARNPDGISSPQKMKPLTPEEYGIRVKEIRDYTNEIAINSIKEFRTSYEILAWLNLNLKLPEQEFGNGNWTSNSFHGWLVRFFQRAIDKLLSLPQEKAQYFLYSVVLYPIMDILRKLNFRSKYLWIIAMVVDSIIASIEINLFKRINRSTKEIAKELTDKNTDSFKDVWCADNIIQLPDEFVKLVTDLVELLNLDCSDMKCPFLSSSLSVLTKSEPLKELERASESTMNEYPLSGATFEQMEFPKNGEDLLSSLTEGFQVEQNRLCLNEQMLKRANDIVLESLSGLKRCIATGSNSKASEFLVGIDVVESLMKEHVILDQSLSKYETSITESIDKCKRYESMIRNPLKGSNYQEKYNSILESILLSDL